jgi:hypothetical protein
MNGEVVPSGERMGAMTQRRLIAAAVIVVATAVSMLIFGTGFWRTIVAVLVAGAVIRLGYGMISSLAEPVPEPPDPGELRQVKIMYRCSNCGAEVRMTVAPQEDPEPPRHCLEDMDLVAPIE